jgi:hypothetical protein
MTAAMVYSTDWVAWAKSSRKKCGIDPTLPLFWPDRGQHAAEHDRALGPALVQQAAAELGGDHEADEEEQQDDASL